LKKLGIKIRLNYINLIIKWGLGIGDWGLGIGPIPKEYFI